MIIKSYELKKFLNEKINIFLLYGQNSELIDETILKEIMPIFSKNLYNYDETEILSNKSTFEESTLNKSFFESEKLVIINRVTDKILELIKDIKERGDNDLKIILKSGVLEKKSKLRNFFEKNNDLIIIPFYEDNHQTLMLYVQNFFKENKIKVSTHNINFILEKTKGDRLNLKNELEKIKSLSQSKLTIEFDDLLKIISSPEDYKISELTDHCLAKNKQKTIKILNDNNSTLEDNILILKSFLFKLKRLEKLKQEIEIKKNQDQVLASFKPTIFCKDKEIIKKQLNSLSIKDIKLYIKKINALELLIKKNTNISSQITNNFIFETIKNTSNLI